MEAGTRWWARLGVALAIGAACLLVLAPMVLVPDIWPDTHEKARYAALVEGFCGALRHGIVYPRWMPDWHGGFGYPTFVFYQPAFFYLAAAFSWLPGFPRSSLAAALFVLLAGGAAGAYRACRLTADRRTSLFCALLFLLTPYLYVDLNVRGDLSELMAMMVLPWPLGFVARLEQKVHQRAPCGAVVAGAAVSLAVLAVAHPLIAMFGYAVFALAAIGLAWGLGPENGLRLAWRSGLAVAAAVLLACPYWQPVIQLRGLVNLNALTEGFFESSLHTVHPHQFFQNTWGFGGSIGNDADQMSFQLGLPHFAVAVAGVLLAGSRKRVLRIWFAAYLGLVVFMTPVAWLAWRYVGPLRMMQFPWRLLAVTASLQAFCAAGLSSLADRGPFRKGRVLPVVLWSTLLWHAVQFMPQSLLNLNTESAALRSIFLHHFRDDSAIGDFMPLTAVFNHALVPRGDGPLVTLDGPGLVRPEPGSSVYHLHYAIRADRPGFATINQYYFRGWRVVLDGRLVTLPELNRWILPDGRMRVQVAPGQTHTLKAHYAGPPGGLLRACIAALGALVVLAYVRWERQAGGIGQQKASSAHSVPRPHFALRLRAGTQAER